jgi:hypothetical protein
VQPRAGAVFDQGWYISANATAVQAVVFLADNFFDKCPGRIGVASHKPLHDPFNEMFFSFVIHQQSESVAV